MRIEIVPAGPDWVTAVSDFNTRLRAGKSEFFFPEYYEPKWLPKLPGRTIYQEIYLVADIEKHTVHGGFILKYQNYKIGAEIHRLAHLQLPLSEGLVNPDYQMMGMMIIRGAQDIERNLYTMGMGGISRILPQGLKKSGWFCDLIPFYFKLLRAPGFLRNIKPLRTSSFRKTVLDLLAVTGLGSLGLTAFDLLKSPKTTTKGLVCERFEEFGQWSDEIWQNQKDQFDFIAEKDSTTMNVLYPPGSKYIKLKISEKGQILGWAVLLVTNMTNHRYFGAMTVCTIVDCLGKASDHNKIVACCLAEGRKGKADVIISNQSYAAFDKVFKDMAFMQTTSNYGLCLSPEIMDILGEDKTKMNQINAHLNRGDGDGPLSL